MARRRAFAVRGERDGADIPLVPNKRVKLAPVVSPGGSTIYKVSVSFDPSNAFWTDLSTSGLSVHFASATCANDVIDGKVTEPGTLLLLGGGLVAMVVAGRKGLARK